MRRATMATFLAIHLMALPTLWIEVDGSSIALCTALYFLRAFGIAAGYHRYLSHRAFKTSRPFQLLLAILGAAACQGGPLWWASIHRLHHRFADRAGDPHSPRDGLLHAHIGWVRASGRHATHTEIVKDLARYPELMWLDRYHYLVPTLLALACYCVGGTSWLVVGFALSTVLLYHAILIIGSLLHMPSIGYRRYETDDDSRNSLAIALLTLGEGLHNNHHHDMGSARLGVRWWEIDVTYYMLRTLSAAAVVWSLREPRASRARGSPLCAGPESEGARRSAYSGASPR